MLGIILLAQALTLAVSGPPSSPEYLPIRVAEAQGYFASEGLGVTVRTTRSEVGAAEALAQGQADLVATSLEAMLRFGPRLEKQQARLVFGLTGAPPATVLVSARMEGTVRSIGDLAGLKVGVSAPGAPELTWFGALLSRAGLRLSQVELVSFGSRGLVSAVESGEVQAGLVHEPHASRLVMEGQGKVLADLRTVAGVQRALGVSTVNAAVFARADRRPPDRDLAAFARALLAAERHIGTTHPSALAEGLPGNVVGPPDEFERRMEALRDLYLREGLVTAEQVRESLALIRIHLTLPPSLKLGSPERMLHTEPLKRAIR
jgi:NitT/TauT family transport system substrate-binding protein